MWNNTEENNWYDEQGRNMFHDCDPIEVRALKNQLALLTAKRNYLQKHSCGGFDTLETASEICDHAVQVKHETQKCDQSTQVSTEQEKPFNVFNPFPYNPPMCPTCLYAFGFLKSGVTKVMKDEELETDFETSDKLDENVKNCVSETTSFTSPPLSSVAFHDYSSECLSQEAYRHRSPKRSNHEVTFWDDIFGQTLPENTFSRSHQCFCVDNFIQSIRPPLK